MTLTLSTLLQLSSSLSVLPAVVGLLALPWWCGTRSDGGDTCDRDLVLPDTEKPAAERKSVFSSRAREWCDISSSFIMEGAASKSKKNGHRKESSDVFSIASNYKGAKDWKTFKILILKTEENFLILKSEYLATKPADWRFKFLTVKIWRCYKLRRRLLVISFLRSGVVFISCNSIFWCAWLSRIKKGGMHNMVYFTIQLTFGVAENSICWR